MLAGLCTSVCIVGPALSVLEQGFEAYVIAEASGGVSDQAHQMAMQRDWARGETYPWPLPWRLAATMAWG